MNSMARFNFIKLPTYNKKNKTLMFILTCLFPSFQLEELPIKISFLNFDYKVLKGETIIPVNKNIIIKNKQDNSFYLNVSLNDFFISWKCEFIFEQVKSTNMIIGIEINDGRSTLNGGNFFNNIYFLSVYTKINILKNKIECPCNNLCSIECKFDILRKFEFFSSFKANTLVVLENNDFNTNYAAHSWDCGWVAACFISSILNGNMQNEQLNEKNYNLHIKSNKKVLKFKQYLVDLFKKKVNLIELGAGCGLMLNYFIKLFNLNQKQKVNPEFYFTDLHKNLPIMIKNYQINHSNKNQVKIISLDWYNNEEIKNLSKICFDLILIFDVIYNDNLHAGLLNTLIEISSKTSKILLGYKPRNRLVEQLFFQMSYPYFHSYKIFDNYGVQLLIMEKL